MMQMGYLVHKKQINSYKMWQTPLETSLAAQSVPVLQAKQYLRCTQLRSLRGGVLLMQSA